MKPSARLGTALATCALAIAATAVALGVAELALRAGAWLEEKPAPPADPELEALPELRGVFELARANVRGRHNGVLWRTNSAGFRGPEVTPLPQPGVFRIAVVGDSFAAGDGVAEKFARIERGLDGFVQLAEGSDACVHVLIHTELAHLRFAHPFRDAYEQIERAAHERGLTVTQSFPAFRWRDSGSLRVSLVDGHPNAEGHRILAEALYAGLHDLPRHCRFPALP